MKIIKKIWSACKKRGVMKTLLLGIKMVLDKVFLSLFRLLPIRNNYIVLESEGDYTDNIRVFYDHLIENKYNQKYKIIWIVHNPNLYKKEENVIFISRFHKGVNLIADYYAGVSKYFVFSHPYWLKNWRKEQIVIGTTHSVYQLKAAPKPLVRTVDYVLACSDNLKNFKAKMFGIKEDNVLVLGMPRIDLLYRQEKCISRFISEYSGERVVISMETFKQGKTWTDSNYVDAYALNFIHNESELLRLNEFLSKNKIYLIVKIHHLQDLSFLEMVHLSNIIYLTDDDLNKCNIITNDLLVNADVLLTDYSSVFYEFLLLDRPIGFSIGDMQSYSRGFISDNPLEEMPGEKIKNLDDFCGFIKNYLNGIDNYIEERNKIRNKVFKYFDDRNCERLINWIENYNNK